MDIGYERLDSICWIAVGGNCGRRVLWCILHFFICIWFLALHIAHALESYLISSGLLKRYRALNIGSLRYLAIVVDSEEAQQTFKVIELLQWLVAIGVKQVCLYDTDGVLKRSKEAIMERLSKTKLYEKAMENGTLLHQKHISMEFASFYDGKEAVAKAANLLFVKNYLDGYQQEPIFTESHISEALRAVGCGGPEPDLLLIYGPARCHLGFPAWRIRYTEIVHMGPLESMKYGSLIKAIHRFTMVRQNYGT